MRNCIKQFSHCVNLKTRISNINDHQCILPSLFVCWSLTSLCHSNGHIETMPAREVTPFLLPWPGFDPSFSAPIFYGEDRCTNIPEPIPEASTTPLLTMQHKKFKSWLCEYCVNIEHKLVALKNAARLQKVSLGVCDKYDIMNKSLCPWENEFHKECVGRKCSNCGVTKLKNLFAPLAKALGQRTTKCQKSSANCKRQEQYLTAWKWNDGVLGLFCEHCLG